MSDEAPKLITGVLADPKRLNEQLTRQWHERWDRDPAPPPDGEGPVVVHPDVFKYPPTGNRLMVVLDPVPKRFGLIWLSEETQGREVMGIGTIVGAGARAGLDIPYPGGPIGEPDMFLYRTILIGQNVGTPLRLKDAAHGDSYCGEVVVMGDRDVLNVEELDDAPGSEA